MAVKFHYFNLNGLGESIRYILHYSNQKFEDIRYNLDEWPIQSVKESLPYGQLPLYEEGNRRLNQSLAIARYVAQKAKLVPSDPWEQAKLDAIALTIYDFSGSMSVFVREQDPERKEKLKQEIMNVKVDYFLSRFEKELQSNGGHFGGKLTWVDFVLAAIMETSHTLLRVKIDQNYPAILALGEKIRSLPGVKEYVSSRKPYEFKLKDK